MCIRYKEAIQDISKIEVRVTSLFGSVIVERSKTKIFLSPITISNFNTSYKYSVYAPDCNKDNEYYIQDPEEGYDQNKIFWKTFGLGVRDIEWDKGSSKMISSFWPDGKNNVWQEIYEVIKDLLDENTRQRISNILMEDIESINQDLRALYDNYTNKTMEIIELQAKYVELIDKLKESENIFILRDNEINLYIIPLYSNFVTMKISLFTSGVAVFQGKLYSQIRRRVVYQYRNYNEYIRRIAKNTFDELYDTVYAGELYVIMNARNHFAWRTLEMVPNGNEFEEEEKSTSRYDLPPFSYSNLYSRATADLLRQAINIEQSPLVAAYNSDTGRVMTLRTNLVYVIKIGNDL